MPRDKDETQQGRDGGEGQHHEREILRRPEKQGELDEEWGQKGDGDRAEGAGNEGADGGSRERCRASPLPGHHIALYRGDDRARLARRVEQDRGRRTSIHRAIIEAGKHDEGASRVELGGDRQEQRDGKGRTDTRQDSNCGAERDADQAP